MVIRQKSSLAVIDMSNTYNLMVRISKFRFAQVNLIGPSGNWFTDVHVQEILSAIADKFIELYNQTQKQIIKTPRTTFSLEMQNKSHKTYVFLPVNQKAELETISSIPRIFLFALLDEETLEQRLRILFKLIKQIELCHPIIRIICDK
jgi:hypothetical protein